MVLQNGHQIVLTPDARQTLEQQLGTSIMVSLSSLQTSSFYELRVSYPATNPVKFIMEILQENQPPLLNRGLLNTEKVMFTTDGNLLVQVSGR